MGASADSPLGLVQHKKVHFQYCAGSFSCETPLYTNRSHVAETPYTESNDL